MHELIYSGKNIEDKIRSKFPSVTITDASDYVHTERFEIEGDTPEDEFYVFAIKEGFILECFGFSMMLHTRVYEDRITQWLNKAREKGGV